MLQAQRRRKDPLLQRLPSRSQLAAIRAPQRVNQPPQGRSLKRQQGKARRCQSRPLTKQQGSRTSSWEAQSRCSLLSAPARTLTGESLSRPGCQWQCLSYALVYCNHLKKHTLHASAGADRQRGQHADRWYHAQARALPAGCPAEPALLQKPRWPGRSLRRFQSSKTPMLRQRLVLCASSEVEDGCAGAGADRQRGQHAGRWYHAQARALPAGCPAAPTFHTCQCHSSALQGEPLDTTLLSSPACCCLHK